jgi:hypothetical protein
VSEAKEEMMMRTIFTRHSVRLIHDHHEGA